MRTDVSYKLNAADAAGEENKEDKGEVMIFLPCNGLYCQEHLFCQVLVHYDLKS